jgi:hypothetical protein
VADSNLQLALSIDAMPLPLQVTLCGLPGSAPYILYSSLYSDFMYLLLYRCPWLRLFVILLGNTRAVGLT